ncbi:MAG: putative redox protein [Acidobacteriaceae bacterium]|jgi:putative redox protein|nr:putative redox protein [Acidobacteriaceae bacterium]
MIAKAEWQHDQIYTATSDSGHTITMDVARDEGPTPTEYVLMALCGCTSVDVVSILKKKRELFTGLTVSATAQKATDYPTVFTAIQLVYRVAGSVNAKSMQDAVRLSKEKYCSVSAMLEKTATITYTIEYADA